MWNLGATTFSVMTLSVMTFSKMTHIIITFNKTTLSIMTFNKMTLSITAFSKTTLSKTTLSIMTFCKMTINITTLSVILSVIILYCYSECHYGECGYAECRGAEIWYLMLSVTPPSPNTQCYKTFSNVMTREEVTASDKHSSLLWYGIHYSCKSFTTQSQKISFWIELSPIRLMSPWYTATSVKAMTT